MIDLKSIIFDFGGVILDIDHRRPEEKFRKLGIDNFHESFSKARQSLLFDDFEKGMISNADFRNGLRENCGKPLTDAEIDHAWNSIIIDLPEKNVEMLQRLRKTHRLFLLSNTNAIHEAAFRDLITKKYGSYILEDLFEKIYLSHHLHLRKPDVKIFQLVVNENDLVDSETLFIDDSPQHLVGAQKAGLQTLLLEKGKTIEDCFLNRYLS